MIIKSTFKPPWWLLNPHLQTLWPKFFRRPPRIKTRRERIELPDGDFLDLDFTPGNNGAMVLVLHGLEGSVESGYAAGILNALDKNGYRACLMHFRNCSGEMNRLPRSYHSGDTGDIAFIIKLLSERCPETSLAAIGYSLGGNALLKYLGETKNQNPLKMAVAVSVPFLLNKAADRFNMGFSRLYQRHLLSSLIKNTLEKQDQQQWSFIKPHEIRQSKTFWQFDDKLTARLHGFKDVHDYYHQSSSRQYLKLIQKPTLILHAEDDPFMFPDVIPENNELSDSVTLEVSQHGGHVGFVCGSTPWNVEYWLDKRIIQFLKMTLQK